MTNNEAIKMLNAAKLMTEGISDLSEACKMAIPAIEKQIPKKPNVYEDKFVHCPNCDKGIGYKWKEYPTKKFNFGWLKYCWNCGQALEFNGGESE